MQINSFDSVNGRKILKDIYFDLKFKKYIKGINLIFILLKICINKENVSKYSSVEVEISHSLGLFRGTAFWIEEVFNRYYFSSINAFVYFGAAILLVLVGLRKFSNLVNDTMVITGFILEASMLVFMFIFMLFNPSDEQFESTENAEDSPQNIIIHEIGEIARDFANATLQLEKISSNLTSVNENYLMTLKQLNEISSSISNTMSPNTEMLDVMKNTNSLLNEFQSNISQLNTELNNIRLVQIETAIRQELEKLLTTKLKNAE